MISIITINLNNYEGLKKTIRSIQSQKYYSYEHIIIDGNSSDGSEIFIQKNFKKNNYIIENDNGIYDAMNKGIKIANNEFILFLNSGDCFLNENILSHYIHAISNSYEIIYGNILLFKKDRLFRKYFSRELNLINLSYGFMPAHPGFACKKNLFEKIGYFNTDFKIAADFDWLLRLMTFCNPKIYSINEFIISMEYGGISNKNLLNKFLLNQEIYKSLKLNKYKANFFKIFFIKNLIKLKEIQFI